ncbi:hypothetical protein OG21DRAFT_6979 [Imleria badia]|nr:hypothetical protein OG21DRAFT_6979 [Imleria badia]
MPWQAQLAHTSSKLIHLNNVLDLPDTNSSLSHRPRANHLSQVSCCKSPRHVAGDVLGITNLPEPSQKPHCEWTSASLSGHRHIGDQNEPADIPRWYNSKLVQSGRVHCGHTEAPCWPEPFNTEARGSRLGMVTTCTGILVPPRLLQGPLPVRDTLESPRAIRHAPSMHRARDIKAISQSWTVWQNDVIPP